MRKYRLETYLIKKYPNKANIISDIILKIIGSSSLIGYIYFIDKFWFVYFFDTLNYLNVEGYIVIVYLFLFMLLFLFLSILYVGLVYLVIFILFE